MENMFNKLVAGLKEAVNAAGFENAVLGLSGGIDSAVSAAIAVKALGPEHVNLAYLPYKSSDPHGFEDAKLVSDYLNTSLIFTDISSMAEPYLNSQINSTPRRKENVLARLRMLILYDYSAMYKALVIGSGNKSELLLGYSTLYGDSACAINPLGELYKTEVWELAKLIKLPEKIIASPLPTIEIAEGNPPYSYMDIDRLLTVFEKGTVEEAINKGFEKSFVDAVAKRIKVNKFKLMPIVVLNPR